MRTCRDAAYPPPDWPTADATLVYAGGDTPNPWTGAGLPPYADTRYAVPAWVRSNPTAASFDADGHAMIAWLHARNAPAGILTMLDLETARDAGYVMGYGATLHSAGYKVAPYGSTSTLFDNPPLDGYWPTDPSTPPQEHLYSHPGVIATQWGYFGSYDLSAITDGVALWDLSSPAPNPTPDLFGGDMLIGDDAQGHLIVVGAAKDNGNLLVFTETAPGTWSVADVTDTIHAANPSDPRSYQVV